MCNVQTDPLHCDQQTIDQKFQQMFESTISMFCRSLNDEQLINTGSALSFKNELWADCQINESSDALASTRARKHDFHKYKQFVRSLDKKQCIGVFNIVGDYYSF